MQVEKVGDLLAVLKCTSHNGFPVVDSEMGSGDAFFCGLLLKRQLLALLRDRVWERQAQGKPLTALGLERFVGSAFAKTSEEVRHQFAHFD